MQVGKSALLISYYRWIALAVLLSLLTVVVACGLRGQPLSSGVTSLAPGDVMTPSAAASNAPGPEPSATATATPTATPVPRRKLTVSLKGLASRLRVPELPARFAPAKPDERLQETVMRTLEGNEGVYSVVVHNLADGRYAVVGPDYIHHTASLFKLAVLAAAYRERDAGRLDFQRLLVIEDSYVEYDLGTMVLLGLEPEDKVSVEDAIKAMIVVSDTSLALMVQDAAGANRVRALVEAEGLTNTSLPKPPLHSTAADMARLFEIIASGKGFTEDSRQEMLSLLLQERTFSGIGAGIPDDVPIANKTGNLSDATHDVAIVWAPSGPYLLAVLSDRAWEWEPTVRVSQAVYEYFAGYSSEGDLTETDPQEPLATPSPEATVEVVATPMVEVVPTPTPRATVEPTAKPIQPTFTPIRPVATPTKPISAPTQPAR